MYSSPAHRCDTLACSTLIINIFIFIFILNGQFNTQDVQILKMPNLKKQSRHQDVKHVDVQYCGDTTT